MTAVGQDGEVGESPADVVFRDRGAGARVDDGETSGLTVGDEKSVAVAAEGQGDGLPLTLWQSPGRGSERRKYGDHHRCQEGAGPTRLRVGRSGRVHCDTSES